jgi:hypothetical protein
VLTWLPRRARAQVFHTMLEAYNGFAAKEL